MTPHDWRTLVGDVSFGLPGAFQLFQSDGAGLNTDEARQPRPWTR